MSFLGRKASIGLGLQSGAGTPKTDPDIIIPTAEPPKIGTVVEKTVKENSGGTNFEGIGDRVSKKKSEGEISMLPSIDSLGWVLLGLFGKVTTTEDNGVFTHNFDVEQENTHPYFTIFKKDPVQSYKYQDVMFSNADIDISGEKIMINSKLLGKSGEKIPDFVSAQQNEVELYPQHVKLKIANSLADLDTAQNMTCPEGVKLSIDKGLIEKSCLGKIDTDVVDGIFKVAFDLTAIYNNTQFNDDLIGDVQKYIRITIEDEAIDLGNGKHPILEFTLYNVKYQSDELDYPSDDMAKANISGVGYLDLTSGKNITSVLVNTTSSYAYSNDA